MFKVSRLVYITRNGGSDGVVCLHGVVMFKDKHSHLHPVYDLPGAGDGERG